jgi:hypothetical protein
MVSLEQVKAVFPVVSTPEHNLASTQNPHQKKPVRSRSERVRWPDYQRCLADHPHHSEQRPDRSAADASFIRIAADYKFSRDEIFHELRRVSERFGTLPERTGSSRDEPHMVEIREGIGKAGVEQENAMAVNCGANKAVTHMTPKEGASAPNRN